MGHTPAITGVGKLLIKPSKEDRAGVARHRTDRSRQRHPTRGQAIHESHPETSTTPTLPASPRPANKKSYRRFIRPFFSRLLPTPPSS